MRRMLVAGFIIALGIGAGAQVALPSQAVQPPAKPAEADKLSTEENLMLQILQLSQQKTDCLAQLGAKNHRDLGEQVLRVIEANHPGQTIDVKTGRLVPKK